MAAVLLLFGLVVVFCRIALARLPDRVAPSRMIAVALGLAALGMGVAGALVSVTGLLVGAAILGVGIAFLTPAVFAATLARVPAAERGSATATVSIFIDLAFGVGPVLVGFVAGVAGIAAGFAPLAHWRASLRSASRSSCGGRSRRTMSPGNRLTAPGLRTHALTVP